MFCLDPKTSGEISSFKDVEALKPEVKLEDSCS